MSTELAALSRRPLAVAMVVALLAPGAALADTWIRELLMKNLQCSSL